MIENKIYIVEVCFPYQDGNYHDQYAYFSHEEAEVRAERMRLEDKMITSWEGYTQIREFKLRGKLSVN